MALVAEFRLASPDLPLVDVAEAVPGVTLRYEVGKSGPSVMVIEATGEGFEALDAALEGAPIVREHSLVVRSEDTRQYKLVMAGSPPADLVAELTRNDSVTDGVTIAADGWHETRRFVDREELAAFREFWCERDIRFELERLYDAGGVDPATGPAGRPPGMTDAQWEALVTAHALGYFEVPREASVADVAAELGITAPSLSERLRRAQSHLVEHAVPSHLIPHTD